MSGTAEPGRAAGDARLDPALALGDRPFDAAALLTLWTLSRAVYPMLWIGMAVAAVAGRLDDFDAAQFQSVGALVGALLSPLVGIVAAVGLRILTGWAALVLTYPLAHAAQLTAPYGGRGRFAPGVWFDRLYLARAYRQWRWTSAVRGLAAVRLGRPGTVMRRLDRILLLANVPLLVAALVVLTVTAS